MQLHWNSMKGLILAVSGVLRLSNSDSARCRADVVFRASPYVPSESVNRVWIAA